VSRLVGDAENLIGSLHLFPGGSQQLLGHPGELDEGAGAPRALGRLVIGPPGDRELSLAAGMEDHLSKPFRIYELEAVCGRWLKTGG